MTDPFISASASGMCIADGLVGAPPPKGGDEG
jgi:hypothetical protein